MRLSTTSACISLPRALCIRGGGDHPLQRRHAVQFNRTYLHTIGELRPVHCEPKHAINGRCLGRACHGSPATRDFFAHWATPREPTTSACGPLFVCNCRSAGFPWVVLWWGSWRLLLSLVVFERVLCVVTVGPNQNHNPSRLRLPVQLVELCSLKPAARRTVRDCGRFPKAYMGAQAASRRRTLVQAARSCPLHC